MTRRRAITSLNGSRSSRFPRPGRGALLALLGGLLFALPARAQIVINEVRPKDSGGSTANQLVELHNTGASAVNIGGWIFCHQFDYGAVLPAGFTIASGGYAVMHFNASGTNTATDVFFPGQVLASTTDLALYANANFTSASAIRAFIQFGGHPGSGRESVAQAAGLWTSGQFVPGVANGHSIELCAGSPAAVTSYVEQATPTIGQENGCGVPVQKSSWSKLKSIFH